MERKELRGNEDPIRAGRRSGFSGQGKKSGLIDTRRRDAMAGPILDFPGVV